MLLKLTSALDELAEYIGRFCDLVGQDRWYKRVNQLDHDQNKSPFRAKVVSDYHWLEMAISFQAEVFAKEGRLLREFTNGPILAALNFAAITVEVHTNLSPKGQQVLRGRLRDCLKAENGFAPLYLELDLAQRLMDSDYDVQFSDLEGAAQFDLLFSKGLFKGEVECKSLSADAGRQIHRKDFYRFMEAITSSLIEQTNSKQHEVLLISLESRLPSDNSSQKHLIGAAISILKNGASSCSSGPGFKMERRPYSEFLSIDPTSNPNAFYKACGEVFGPNPHVGGGFTEEGGCIVVMRSEREDDTSKPMLRAMREAAGQFSGKLPAFIAIQEHGIEPPDLMLPHVRRRAAILSHALFNHYGASHVNSTYFTGFGAVVERGGLVGTPAFAIPNRDPLYVIDSFEAAPFLVHISDEHYAAFIGAPLPAPNISSLPAD